MERTQLTGKDRDQCVNVASRQMTIPERYQFRTPRIGILPNSLRYRIPCGVLSSNAGSLNYDRNEVMARCSGWRHRYL